MSLLPRLRQVCRPAHQGPTGAAATDARGGRAPDASADAPPGHCSLAGTASALRGEDSRLVLNRLFLSGILAADSHEDEGRDGQPVTLLLIAFPAPDAKNTEERVETASCEIEVPGSLADRHGEKLRAGNSIFITGQLSGGGGVVATEIHAGPPPGAERGRNDSSSGRPPQAH
jgi:Single-strand binding protein family